jgi:hypothetical protein
MGLREVLNRIMNGSASGLINGSSQISLEKDVLMSTLRPPTNTATDASLLHIAKVGLILFAWFGIGTVLIFSNRILLTSGLQAPISLTVLHMCASFVFASTMVVLGGFKPQACKSSRQRIKVVCLAIGFGASVVTSVASFSFIPVSFYEVFAFAFACSSMSMPSSSNVSFHSAEYGIPLNLPRMLRDPPLS